MTQLGQRPVYYDMCLSNDADWVFTLRLRGDRDWPPGTQGWIIFNSGQRWNAVVVRKTMKWKVEQSATRDTDLVQGERYRMFVSIPDGDEPTSSEYKIAYGEVRRFDE